MTDEDNPRNRPKIVDGAEAAAMSTMELPTIEPDRPNKERDEYNPPSKVSLEQVEDTSLPWFLGEVTPDSETFDEPIERANSSDFDTDQQEEPSAGEVSLGPVDENLSATIQDHEPAQGPPLGEPDEDLDDQVARMTTELEASTSEPPSKPKPYARAMGLTAEGGLRRDPTGEVYAIDSVGHVSVAVVRPGHKNVPRAGDPGAWSEDADAAAGMMASQNNPAGMDSPGGNAGIGTPRKPSRWRRPLLLTLLATTFGAYAALNHSNTLMSSTNYVAQQFSALGNYVGANWPNFRKETTPQQRSNGLDVVMARAMVEQAQRASLQRSGIEPPKKYLEGTFTVPKTAVGGLSHLAAAILGEHQAGRNFFTLTADKQEELFRTTYNVRTVRAYDQEQLRDVLIVAMLLAEQNSDTVRNEPSPDDIKRLSYKDLLQLTRDSTKWVVWPGDQLELRHETNKLDEAYELAEILGLGKRRDPLDRRRRRLEDKIERDALAYMDTYEEGSKSTAELYDIDEAKLARKKELDDRMQEHALRYQVGENIASIMDSTDSSLQKIYYDLNKAGINAVAERKVELYEAFLREKGNNPELTKIGFARRHAEKKGVTEKHLASQLNTNIYLEARMQLIA
tara:strand:+ start:519 stop:2387 length:1869 start_codon:yes stop_codon:yes gene_type:complete